MLEGIDVSYYQSRIDWQLVAESNKKFAYVRTSFGLQRDQLFASHVAGAQSVGIAVGGYLFACPEHSALEQAHLLAELAGELVLPPCIDLEALHGVSPSTVLDWVETFVAELEFITRREAIGYTGGYFWNELLRKAAPAKADSSILHARDLWHSQYTLAPRPKLPQGFSDWKIWQYLADPSPAFPHAGKCPGVTGNCDLNRFNGGDEEFAVWVAAHAVSL